jgi:hypothetical protein
MPSSPRPTTLVSTTCPLRGYWLSFRHLLEWSDSTLFGNSIQIEPTYPVNKLTARKDGKDNPLSPVDLDNICTHAQVFFKWAKWEYPTQYKKIYPSWIDALRSTKASMANIEFKNPSYGLKRM